MNTTSSTLLAEMHIALCGMMGSGKSAIGRRLASLLDIPFTDLDALVEQDAGMSIPRIFETEGEASFRQREKFLLKKKLATRPCVIGLGGGTLQDEHVLKELKKTAFLCFIDTPLDVISERVQRNTNRPLLLDKNGNMKPESEVKTIIKQLYSARLPLYRQARLRYVPEPGNSVHDSAGELLERIRAAVA